MGTTTDSLTLHQSVCICVYSPRADADVQRHLPELSGLRCRLSVVKSYCGHGIGDLFHCAPNVPHYSPNKAVGVMKEGQTFTIEVCFSPRKIFFAHSMFHVPNLPAAILVRKSTLGDVLFSCAAYD